MESEIQPCYLSSCHRYRLTSAIASLNAIRALGGRVFWLLSERLFKRCAIADAIYIPVLDVADDYLGVISDRATPPAVRQALAKKLDGVRVTHTAQGSVPCCRLDS
jgi:hypothetical protein